MAKIKITLLCLFWFAICTIASSQTTVRDRVQQTYYSQIGVRELTGKNDGQQVEKYLQSVGFKKGYAWCAAFVNWSLTQSGVKTINNAWVPAWFIPNKVIYKNRIATKPPQQGDLFGIYYSKHKRVGHIGFVDKWGEKFVITVEGNTNEAGSREGDGVYKKRRLKAQIYIVANWID